MKRFFITLSIVCFALHGFSQTNSISLNGGYVFTNVDASETFEEDPNVQATGWRINGTYDYNPNDGQVAYGFSIGYVSVGATYEGTADTSEYKVNSVPFYFAPKYLFGSEKVGGFVNLR